MGMRAIFVRCKVLRSFYTEGNAHMLKEKKHVCPKKKLQVVLPLVRITV